MQAYMFLLPLLVLFYKGGSKATQRVGHARPHQQTGALLWLLLSAMLFLYLLNNVMNK